MRRVLASLLPGLLLAGCATTPESVSEPAEPPAVPPAPPSREYAGEVEVFLLPYDEQGACSITIGLRNISDVRHAEARFQLAWLNANSELLADQSLRMDGLRPGRYDAKNLSLPVRCKQVSRLLMKTAEWTLFEGWDSPLPVVVPIAGAHATEWRLRWNPELGAFAGEQRKEALD